MSLPHLSNTRARQSLGTVFALALASCTSLAASTKSTQDAAPEPPPLPAIQSLVLDPSSLELQHGRDERRVLVLGLTDSKQRIDLTATAQFELGESSPVRLTPDGFLAPRAKGSSEIVVRAAGRTAKLPVTVSDATLPPVRFVRDIQPVLGKLGCNAGTCHGSAKGKNGFKLSLRGYDTDFDYHALILDLAGRRYERAAVDQSLLLLKPLAEIPHEGRQALKPDSREQQLLRQWLVEGAPPESKEAGRPTRLEVLPAEVDIDLPGRIQQILVLAHYPDKAVRDVTRDAVFSSSNEEIMKTADGTIRTLRRGEAAVLIRYEGLYATKLVTVMGDRSGYQWADVPEFNEIDKLVHAKHQRMKILPSELCTDAEFIRRVSLDLTGLPPQPDRVRGFLADPAPSREKRERLIDDLLKSQDYIEFWANKWADLLQCNSEKLGQKAIWLYRDWIRQQITQNKPYDQFVRSLLTAQGSAYENPAVNYLRVLRDSGRMTEDVSQTFLGIRFNCNKCHDHPFEKWTQDQYYEFAAFFGQVGFKPGFVERQTIFEEAGGSFRITAEEILFRKPEGGEVEHPKSQQVIPPKVPFGTARATATQEDRRQSLADWLTAKDNPVFAKAMANRLWSYFLGKGIIDPVDDIRASNPPSNPELLEFLTQNFVQSNFDIKHLMRTICLSRTYQLSIIPNRWNADDSLNFSHALPRRLSAEQLLDALTVATGHPVRFAGAPEGMRSVEMPDGKIPGADFLALFGRPKRQSACECERTSNLTLSHALSLINGTTISEAVHAPDNRIAKLVEAEKDASKVVDTIYQACLNRPATDDEIKAVGMENASNRLEMAQDLTWALVNSPAFLFNR